MEFKDKIYYSKVFLAGLTTIVCNLITICGYLFGFGHAQAFGVAFGWGILVPYYFFLAWKLNDKQIELLGGKKKIMLEGIGGYIFFWVSTWALSYTFLHTILWPDLYTSEILGPTFFSGAPYWVTSVVILSISFSLSMTSSLLSRKIMDVKRLKRYSKEIKKFKDLEKHVRETADRKAAIKLKRKQKYIEKITRTVMWQRLKPMAIYFVPFLILFIVLSSTFGNTTAAMFPFNIGKVPLLNMFVRPPWGVYIPMGYALSYVSWYIISSFGFTTVIQKILGLRFEQ
ncbi:MAG: EMC3/TMCO1 family protein [Candidatus Helarchaeota archaeon]